ncbi:MAG TPA: hypothetical protein VIM16_11820 [Mucilaginibacter sp.]|jgi:hypothetical protein
MKNWMIIIIGASITCFSIACTCGRNPQTGKDTVTNTYKMKDSSKIDTGNTTSSDNSASGGANLVKDTSKHVKHK